MAAAGKKIFRFIFRSFFPTPPPSSTCRFQPTPPPGRCQAPDLLKSMAESERRQYAFSIYLMLFQMSVVGVAWKTSAGDRMMEFAVLLLQKTEVGPKEDEPNPFR
ncbi:unnamed protein product [Microthlaspi erraticum]|uniref:Uncharacterized protein n=1 Tax=Microthlaspi erraticum TaxID=1685480 RepID=A0A6D2KCH1_9BRAS|nr:unnamed protein product [Microthlaspi erraticum]